MRLAQFEDHDGRGFLGVLSADDEVVEISEDGAPRGLDLIDYLSWGEDRDGRLAAALAAAPDNARRPLEGLAWRTPTMRSRAIVCLGLNYRDHVQETGQAPASYPSFFLRTAGSLVAHEAAIVRPSMSEALDFEGELAAVIGRRVRGASRATALDAVAGYAVFNDASVRDYQFKSSQWTMGKNFDATGAFGPWFVTADELPPGAAGLRLEVRLNGQVVQSANTADMICDLAEAIALISECMTLEPGDLIVTGTPGGVGMARTPPLWMRPGDVCEVEIEGVGLLRNPIATAGTPLQTTPRAGGTVEPGDRHTTEGRVP